MKTARKERIRLTLNRETLRMLEEPALREANGGAPSHAVSCPSSCPLATIDCCHQT